MKLFSMDLKNVGDNLNEPILRWLGLPMDGVTTDRAERGKFVGAGSLMTAVRKGDVVWGTGIMRPDARYERARSAKFLAVRGKHTRQHLLSKGVENIPEVYGDPGLLMPLIYDPQWNFGNSDVKVAYMPHYIEKAEFWRQHGKLKQGEAFIDAETTNWKKVVRQIKQADLLVTSSLHGIILADAYGVPVEWVGYTNNIIGGKWKFFDYFSVTGRSNRKNYGKLPPLARSKLKELQDGLVKAISDGLEPQKENNKS